MPIYKYLPKYPSGAIHNPRGLYLTNFKSASEIEASNFLAIPYRPLVRCGIRQYLPDAECFLDYGRGGRRRRIWAAWGKHGGAWEFQSDKRFVPPRVRSAGGDGGRWSLNGEYPNGGTFDEYSNYAPGWDTVHGRISAFGAISAVLGDRAFVLDALGKSENVDPESFANKIPDDFPGGALYWKRGILEFTVSFLLQQNEKHTVAIRLWGSVWHDEEKAGFRRPVTRRHFVEPVILTIPGIAGCALDGVLRNSIRQAIQLIALRIPTVYPAAPGCLHASNTTIRRLPS